MLNILDYKQPIAIPGSINVWKFQFEQRPDLIRSMLDHREGRSTRLMARKLELRKITSTDAYKFLDRNHLNGPTRGAELCYALCDSVGPALVITLGRPRYTTRFDLEVLRLASRQGIVVVGGASRLFTRIKTDTEKSILTYSDMLLGNGEVYRAAGFTPLGSTRAGYFWEKDGAILHRHQTQKHRLVKLLGNDIDLTLSERTLMQRAGWWKVEDLGHLRWGMGLQHDSELHQRRHNFVYKVTRPLIDDKFYIGMHSTDRLGDGYLGSGNIISASLQKYGREMHVREILNTFKTRAEALEAEKQLVTVEQLADPRCMNISLGGGNPLLPSGATNGRVSLWHSTGNERKVLPEEVPIFIARGWELGRHPSNKKHLHGNWFIRTDGTQGRSADGIPKDATAGKVPTTTGRKWVVRGGRRQLVVDVLASDVISFTPSTTNKGKVVRSRDGKRRLFTLEEAGANTEWHTPPPPTLGRIGMRSPTGEKKLVSPAEARSLSKIGWVIATRQLKSAPLQVLELAAELGMKLPKKRKIS